MIKKIPRDDFTLLHRQIKRYLDTPNDQDCGIVLRKELTHALIDNYSKAQVDDALAFLVDELGWYTCEQCFAIISTRTSHIGTCPNNVSDEAEVLGNDPDEQGDAQPDQTDTVPRVFRTVIKPFGEVKI